MIVPTVGRVVWYWLGYGAQEQPMAAIVTHVYNERMVNVAQFDIYGSCIGRSNVTLVQDGDVKPVGTHYCEWMPYQTAVAKGEIQPVLHAPGELAATDAKLAGAGEVKA